MSNLNDLSLENVASEDYDKIVGKIEAYYKQDSLQKSALAYNWERNHLMLDGQQWLIYDGNREQGGIWRKLQPSPQNEYIPRPVTNYMFDAYQTLKGYFLKNQIRSTVRPNTSSTKDKTAAKIGELVVETNWERLHDQENYEYAISNAITYGTVFKKDYWDTSALSIAKVPKMVQRPVVDPQTGQPSGQMEEIQEVDMMGQPVFEEIPIGDCATAIVEPYKIALDPLSSGAHDCRWIMEYAIRPISWIMENYDKQEPGYTGRAGEVKAEKTLPSSLRRFFQLKTSPGVRGTLNPALASTAGYGDDQMIEEAAVVKEYYERPTRQSPKGRLLVVANGVCLYSGPSPYEGPDQGDWHPYSEFRWEIVPGRFWGKSPFDDTTEVQKQINSIDSIIVLTRKTMAVPQKLVPRGTMTQGDNWTGQPGQKVVYTPGAGGEKPETIPPVGVDASVFNERAQRVEDLKQITGAIDILKGDRPPGVTAYSALSLLFEVGTGKLAPVLNRWRRFIECSQRKQLKLVANKYKEPRPEFIRKLASKNKELTPEQISSFIGTDLHDNCNVVIEASSAIPKLLAAEHAKLQELAAMGVLNLENPANRAEFLDRFGIIGFDSDYSKDAKRGEWENDMMDDLPFSPDNRPVMLVTDNHDIHIAVHEERTKEPSFMQLPIEVQQAYFAHIQEHQDAKAQAEQMQMMQAAMMGMPPQPQPNPMQEKEAIRKGSPPTAKQRDAMTPDLTGPFGTKGN